MEPSWSKNSPSDRKRAIQELVRGREIANQLHTLLNKSLENDGSIPKEHLVSKILDSFTNTLLILNDCEFNEISQVPTKTHLSSPCRDGRKSEDSGESIKSSMHKERRGCYKRRKSSHTWTKDTSSLVDDGHAWRKYGQKVILNAQFPRHYFRCTHKLDQGCQATKQVQMIQDNPPLYRTTYYGHHTCNNFLKTSHLILDSADSDSSILLSFENTTAPTQSANPFVLSFPSSVKRECKDDAVNDDLTHNNSNNNNSDYLLSPDLTTFDSCTASTHSFDMDVMVASDEFEDVLQFEF